MKRREFITLLGGAAVAAPVVAQAQQGEMRRIAILMGTATTELGKSYLATFIQRLEQLGWANGRNARIETRWWTGTLDEMRPVVAELLAFSPDVIMAFSNPAVALLKPIAGKVPIIFVGVGDPIGDGFVASLARPGFGVEVTQGGVHDAAEIERAILSFATTENGGIVVTPHAITWANEDLIIALSLQHRLPSHYATAASVRAGGLVCYGHDFEEAVRKTADYVDRILRGERAGDLPVQMPTKFRLVVNLKTAKTIGVDVPPTLVVCADEVIE